MPPRIEGGGTDSGVPDRLKKSSSSPSVDYADDSGGSTRETADVVEASPHRLSGAENQVVDSDGGDRETTTVVEGSPSRTSEAAKAILDGASTTDGYGPDPNDTRAEQIEAAGGTSYEEGVPASEGGLGGMPGSPGGPSTVTDYEGDTSQSGTNVSDKEVTTPDENPGGGAAGDVVNETEDAVNDAADSAKNAVEAAKNEITENVDVDPEVNIQAGNLVEYALGAAIVGGLAYAASGSGSGGGA